MQGLLGHRRNVKRYRGFSKRASLRAMARLFPTGWFLGRHYLYQMMLKKRLKEEFAYHFMSENLSDRRAAAEWNAGFVFGWIAALCENDPGFFFTSLVIPWSAPGRASLSVATLQEG